MSLFVLNTACECVRKIIYEFSTDWSLNEVPVTVASLNQFCCTLCPLHWALVFAHIVCYVTAAWRGQIPSCFGESFGLGDPTGMGPLSNCFPIVTSDW